VSESNVVPLTKEEEKFPLEPFSDIVVIEQLEEEKTKGGLILVGQERKYASGRVVAVGPGRVYSDYMDASGQRQFGQIIPTTVKVGDWVCFGKYQSGGEPILLNGKKYLMAREGDLGGRSVSGEPLEIKLAVDQQ
jgi:co-chaperonin GroES (HSP10)